jgi:hypothetical protein
MSCVSCLDCLYGWDGAHGDMRGRSAQGKSSAGTHAEFPALASAKTHKKWSVGFASIAPVMHAPLLHTLGASHGPTSIPPGSMPRSVLQLAKARPSQSQKFARHSPRAGRPSKCTRTKHSRHAVTGAATGAITRLIAQWVRIEARISTKLDRVPQEIGVGGQHRCEARWERSQPWLWSL